MDQRRWIKGWRLEVGAPRTPPLICDEQGQLKVPENPEKSLGLNFCDRWRLIIGGFQGKPMVLSEK